MLSLSKKKAVFTVALLFVLFVTFAMFLELMQFQNKEVEVTFFNDGWDITYNESRMGIMDIEQPVFRNIHAGDRFVLKNRLPEILPTGCALNMNANLSMVEMSIDGKLIYSYGYDLLAQEKMMGSGYHTVELPEEARGKEIEIVIIPGENDAFTAISNIELGTTMDLYTFHVRSKIMATMIYDFLTILGGAALILAIGSLLCGNRYVRFIPVGFFSFVIGLYGLASSSYLELTGISNYANTMCEYISLYLMPLPVILLFAMNKRCHKGLLYTLYGTAIGYGLFFVSVCGLHFSNVIHFPKVLYLYHVIGILLLGLGVSVIIYHAKNHTTISHFNLIGFVVLTFASTADLCRYHFQKNIIPDNTHFQLSIIPIGALFYIMLELLDDAIAIQNMALREAETKLLAKLAYQDELCQINNRTKCMEDFKILERSKDPVALIDFDLNGLKMINDTFGHTNGDVLIHEFAMVLNETFDGIGTPYRIGGDEFIVVVRGERISQIEEALIRLREVETEHSKQVNIPIFSSFGVAYSHENKECNFNCLYAIADQRMYKMKETYHKKQA